MPHFLDWQSSAGIRYLTAQISCATVEVVSIKTCRNYGFEPYITLAPTNAQDVRNWKLLVPFLVDGRTCDRWRSFACKVVIVDNLRHRLYSTDFETGRVQMYRILSRMKLISSF